MMTLKLIVHVTGLFILLSQRAPLQVFVRIFLLHLAFECGCLWLNKKYILGMFKVQKKIASGTLKLKPSEAIIQINKDLEEIIINWTNLHEKHRWYIRRLLLYMQKYIC